MFLVPVAHGQIQGWHVRAETGIALSSHNWDWDSYYQDSDHKSRTCAPALMAGAEYRFRHGALVVETGIQTGAIQYDSARLLTYSRPSVSFVYYSVPLQVSYKIEPVSHLVVTAGVGLYAAFSGKFYVSDFSTPVLTLEHGHPEYTTTDKIVSSQLSAMQSWSKYRSTWSYVHLGVGYELDSHWQLTADLSVKWWIEKVQWIIDNVVDGGSFCSLPERMIDLSLGLQYTF